MARIYPTRKLNRLHLVHGLVVAILLLAGLPWAQLEKQLALNLAAKITADGLLAAPRFLVEANDALAKVAVKHCRANWLRGFVAKSLQQDNIRDSAWREAARCSPDLIGLLTIAEPAHASLADLIVRDHPENAEAWFWLAGIRAQEMPEEGIELYLKGLTLSPQDGRRWKLLGDLLIVNDPNAAINAYLQSCFNSDPGYNGCWRAGQTAEQLGEFENALRYYRYSHWEVALNRAAELEAQIAENTQP